MNTAADHLLIRTHRDVVEACMAIDPPASVQRLADTEPVISARAAATLCGMHGKRLFDAVSEDDGILLADGCYSSHALVAWLGY